MVLTRLPLVGALGHDKGVVFCRSSVKCKAVVGKVLCKHLVCRYSQRIAALAHEPETNR